MISEADKSKLAVGFKQVLRAVKEDKAAKIFLAEDCESKISVPVEQAASEKGVQLFYVPTMRELGELCGIDVSSSCAVVIK